MIEPTRDVEIDLLPLAQAIRSARIQKLARSEILRIVANILHKQARPLGHFFSTAMTSHLSRPQAIGSESPKVELNNAACDRRIDVFYFNGQVRKRLEPR
jgi:hypothetical protein